MGTKMKGLLKGLRYISQIFDEEKEPEMQIGFPTDVKHVAHIGWDGPSVNTPSWMNNFKTPEYSSAPLDMAGSAKENPAANGVYEEPSSRRSSREQNSPARDLQELPKSSRRQSLNGILSTGSPSRDKSGKPKHSRRHQLQQQQDPSLGIDSPSQNLPEIPKKSRRKKSKDASTGGSNRSSRSKANSSSTTYASPFSDPGSGGSRSMLKNSDFCPTSPLPSRKFKEAEDNMS